MSLSITTLTQAVLVSWLLRHRGLPTLILGQIEITYHRSQSSICFAEILQFYRRCLGPPVFRNKLGGTGMTHRKKGWTG
jgi:hypothetical protein